MRTVNLITVDALDDLPAIEGLAVELATVGGCEIVAACGTISAERYPAPEMGDNYLVGEGNRHDRNRFNEVLDGLLPSQGARRARAGGPLDSA